VLSRAAEAVYWMSRYAERAENVARFLDVTLQVMLDFPDSRGNPWQAVVASTGDEGALAMRYGAVTRDAVVRCLTIDADSPNSILSCLRHARENARSIREAISSEMWEQINKWYLLVRDFANGPNVIEDPHELLAAVKEASHLFVGVTYLTMTHGEAWHFGRLGRVLERADQTSRIVDAKEALIHARPPDAAGSLDGIDLTALLRSVSALEMYRKRYGRIERAQVIGFLILDKWFPRSIRHCLENGQDSLRAIGGTAPEGSTLLPERLLGRLAAEYEYAVVDEIVSGGLRQHLDDLQGKINAVGAAIHETFFAIRAEPVSEPDEQPARAQQAAEAQAAQ
jgi:uncharacterized alpha-E superfamily protein